MGNIGLNIDGILLDRPTDFSPTNLQQTYSGETDVDISWVNNCTADSCGGKIEIYVDGSLYVRYTNTTPTIQSITGLTPYNSFLVYIKYTSTDGIEYYSNTIRVFTDDVNWAPAISPLYESVYYTDITITNHCDGDTCSGTWEVYLDTVLYATSSTIITTQRIAGLLPNTDYYVYVKYIGSDSTEWDSTTILLETTNYDPYNLEDIDLQLTDVTVDWNNKCTDDGCAGTWNVFVDSVLYSTSGTIITSQNITGLTEDTSYSIYVQYVDVFSETHDSNVISATTLPLPPYGYFSITDYQFNALNFEPVSVNISSNSSWVVSGSESWILITNGTGTDDGTISIGIVPNASGTIQSGTVTIELNGGTGVQNINQISLLSYPPDGIYLEMSGSTATTFGDVTHDIDWETSAGNSWVVVVTGSTWLSCSNNCSGSGDATITIEALENMASISRNTTIEIRSDDGSVFIYVRQNPHQDYCYAYYNGELLTNLEVYYGASTYIIDVQAYRTNDWYFYHQGYDWITTQPSYSGGTGDGSFWLQTLDNTGCTNRIGTVGLSNEGTSYWFDVFQHANKQTASLANYHWTFDETLIDDVEGVELTLLPYYKEDGYTPSVTTVYDDYSGGTSALRFPDSVGVNKTGATYVNTDSWRWKSIFQNRLTKTSEYTICVYVKNTGTVSEGGMVVSAYSNNNSTFYNGIELGSGGDSGLTYSSQGATGYAVGFSYLPVDGWHHVAYTVEEYPLFLGETTARFKTYVDGVLIKEDKGEWPDYNPYAPSDNSNDTFTLVLGKIFQGIDVDTTSMDIAHLRFYDYYLSLSEITSVIFNDSSNVTGDYNPLNVHQTANDYLSWDTNCGGDTCGGTQTIYVDQVLHVSGLTGDVTGSTITGLPIGDYEIFVTYTDTNFWQWDSRKVPFYVKPFDYFPTDLIQTSNTNNSVTVSWIPNCSGDSCSGTYSIYLDGVLTYSSLSGSLSGKVIENLNSGTQYELSVAYTIGTDEYPVTIKILTDYEDETMVVDITDIDDIGLTETYEIELDTTFRTYWTTSILSGGTSWITINNEAGLGDYTLDVTLTGNTTGYDRTAYIEVNSTAPQEVITVFQSNYNYGYFEAGSTTYRNDESGLTYAVEIDITSNVPWEVNTPPHISIDGSSTGTGDGSVTFYLSSENTGSTFLTDYLTLTLSGGTTTNPQTNTYEIVIWNPPMIFDLTVLSGGELVRLPGENTSTGYDYYVDWGDGTSITNYTNGYTTTHTYSSSGDNQVRIWGDFRQLKYYTPFEPREVPDPYVYTTIDNWRRNVTEVVSWGNSNLELIQLYTDRFPYESPGVVTRPPYGYFNLTAIDTDTYGQFSEFTTFEDSFRGVGITTLPTGLFDYAVNATYFASTFMDTLITSIPTGLLDNVPNMIMASYLFRNTPITSIPLTLFDNNPGINHFRGTFFDCSSASRYAPDLWAQTIHKYRYTSVSTNSCFGNCTGLWNYGIIPTTWGGVHTPTTVSKCDNLEQTFTGDTSVSITWDNHVEADYYGVGNWKIYLDTVLEDTINYWDTDYSPTGYTITGLDKYSSPTVYIKYTAGLTGTQYNSDPITVYTTIPDFNPDNLQQTFSGITTASLTWDTNCAGDSCSGYQSIYVDDVLYVSGLSGSLDEYSVTGLTSDSGYTSYVTYTDTNLYVYNSNEITIYTNPLPDYEPTNLVQTDSGYTTASLTWTTNCSGETCSGTQEMYVDTVLYEDGLDGDLSGLTISGLTIDSSYTVYVKYIGSETLEYDSSGITIYTNPLPDYEPTNLVQTFTGYTTASLDWNTNCSAELCGGSQSIYLDEGLYLSGLTGDLSGYTISGLTADSGYTVYVKYIDTDDYEYDSSSIGLYTTSPTPTDVVQTVFDFSGGTITWTTNCELDSCNGTQDIYIDDVLYVSGLDGDVSGSTISGLTADSGYTLYVKYIDTDTNEWDSDEMIFYTPSLDAMIIKITVTSGNELIKISSESGYNYDYNVYWGDGTSDYVTTYNGGTHTYSSTGDYTIIVDGTCEAWSIGIGYNLQDAITEVVQWGNIGLKLLYLINTNITSLPDDTRGAFSLITDYLVFLNNTSLTSIGSGLFDYAGNLTTKVEFSTCSSLTTLPSGVFDGLTGVTSFQSTFQNCNLTTLPSGLFDYCTEVTSFQATFQSCNLTTLPSGLFDNNTLVTTFEGTFAFCEITSIPSTLFDSCTGVTSYVATFYGVTELTGASPELWNLIPEPNGVVCFYQCLSLTNYGSIPNDWK